MGKDRTPAEHSGSLSLSTPRNQSITTRRSFDDVSDVFDNGPRTGNGGANGRRLPGHGQPFTLQSNGDQHHWQSQHIFRDERRLPAGVPDRPAADWAFRGPLEPRDLAGRHHGRAGHHGGRLAVCAHPPLVVVVDTVVVGHPGPGNWRRVRRQRRTGRFVVAVHERHAVQLGAPRRTGVHVLDH